MHEHRCNLCKRLVILLLAGLAAGAAAAQAPPVCESAPYRAFDFWLGTWQVDLPDGQAAGRNVIAREQAGCVLVERWEGAGGGTGMSMNFYDPAAGHWRQLWVSAGTQIDIAGNLRDGAMVLEGTITYLQDARTRPFRGTWTPLADGRVRQFFEEAAGGEWTPWFEGVYTRVAAPGPAAAEGRQ